MNSQHHQSPWHRFSSLYFRCDTLGLSLDISRMGLPDHFLDAMHHPLRRAFDEMADLEAGALANPDESRMVGHYWLRAPHLSPTPQIRDAITTTLAQIKSFAADVHHRRITAPAGLTFNNVLLIGIGGSALGPQLLADALALPHDPMRLLVSDNTDPDGFDRLIDHIGPDLPRTLVLVVSKSGGTRETHNATIEIRRQLESANLDFPPRAVAVTCPGSRLDQQALRENWLKRFPMWDWVGGRTSLTSAVGLLPAALIGREIDAILAGAAQSDHITRLPDVAKNPAAVLAAAWHHAASTPSPRHMVLLPYRDRLALLARYLQQLLMESLGKRSDRSGRTVHQGLTVFGNKGSTDQHAFVQQLRDGRNDFFAAFVDVLRDRRPDPFLVEPDAAAGDYLHAFLLGTRQALHDANRPSLTITLDELNERSLAALLALFERAVGLYASLINVNAYDQPGVEAGKKAADQVIALQQRLLAAMRQRPNHPATAQQWSDLLNTSEGSPVDPETVFHILTYLSADPIRQITRHPAANPLDARFSIG